MTATRPEVEATHRYTKKEVAQHLGVSKRTVERYIAEGKITAQYRKANMKPFITGLKVIKAWNQTY